MIKTKRIWQELKAKLSSRDQVGCTSSQLDHGFLEHLFFVLSYLLNHSRQQTLQPVLNLGPLDLIFLEAALAANLITA